MKSLKLVTALGFVLGATLLVPPSTHADDRGRSGSRGRSSYRYDRRDDGRDRHYDRGDRGRGHGYDYRYDRSYRYGRSYRPSYSYRSRRPYYSPYVYSYSYDPYYYEDDYYYAPPAYYVRPYYRPRLGVVVGRPRVGLYLGW
jgi:hypothetical protein